MKQNDEEIDEALKLSSITFHPSENGKWLMRLTREGNIQFNREAYPQAQPDDFALAVIGILENKYKIKFWRENETK